MEQCVLERIEAMESFLKEEKEGLLKRRLAEIESMLQGDAGGVYGRLKAAFHELTPEDGRGVLALSYLRSSYITGRHEFYLAFYTGEPFVEEPDGLYLDMKSVFEAAEDDLREMNRRLGEEFVRIIPAEKEEIRRWYMGQLYGRFGEVLESLSEDKGREVYFGGYMEELKPAGRMGVEGI